MNRKKLAALRRKVDAFRQSQPKARDLQSLAKSLGREEDNRGKEPTWVSQFVDLYPLSIPNHKGKDMPTGTKNSILDQMEVDLDKWEETLDEWEKINDQQRH
jgi:hypothetical protein